MLYVIGKCDYVVEFINMHNCEDESYILVLNKYQPNNAMLLPLLNEIINYIMYMG